MPSANARLRTSSLLVATAVALLTFAPFAAAQSAGARPAARSSADLDEPAPPACGLPLSPATDVTPPADPAAPTPLSPPPTGIVKPSNAAFRAASPAAKSPRGLVPLFASYAIVQALDVHSTLTAVRGGAVEQNALVAPLVRHPAAFIALKAAMTTGTILTANRLARHNRVAAYALMFALNSAYTFVVVHNYHVANLQ